VDLNSLLHRHQLSLMKAESGLTPHERQAHDQFSADYAAQIRRARDDRGARPATAGAVT